MQAKELVLKDFRNYTEQTVSFGEGVNILHGDNAQGKTNILEAVYLFSMGKPSRARRDAELIRHGQNKAELSLTFSDKEREHSAAITLYADRRKTVTVNDIPIRKNSELVGRFRVVYFGPEYLGLVKEGPSVRRRNIDILISQLRPRYVSALGDAKKLVESKNALLRMEKPNQSMLQILNEKLASVSAEVIICRQQYLKRVGEIAAQIQQEISNGSEALEIRYRSCIGEAKDMEREAVKEGISKRLDEVWKRELDMRESVIGPHREDIGYLINGQDAKAFASQGQQKTIVLVQKLAEVELMHEETGELPVLLLDDIMSELDKKRQGFILNRIRDMQMLITCTDTDGFVLDKNARLFRVENGTVV